MPFEHFSRPSRVYRALLFGAFLIPASTQASGFRIAGNVEGFSTFNSVAMSNSGQVAFTAQRFVGGQQVPGAYKASGGGFRTILEGTYTAPDGTVVTGGGLAAINDAGKTAFWFTERVGAGLFAAVYTGAGPFSDADFTSNGGAFPLRIDGSGLVANDLNINQAGSIEFANYVFIDNPNATGSQVGAIFGLAAVLLDNQNNVLVPSGPGTPVRKIHMGLVTSPGSPHIGPVATNTVGIVPSDLTGAGPWAMNASGTVVFQGSKNGQFSGIYRLGGGPIVEVNAGSEYDLIRNFALNDSGVVAFYGHSRTLNKWGFFKGPNAVADKILLEGEQVAGVTLSAFSPLPSATRWFNNSGQVVFKALNALWVADGGVSPPEAVSTVLRWNPPVSPPSGSFAIAGNWQPANSDPPRVPQKTSTLNDTALFDLAETYTVAVGQQHTERLLVKNGNVTFADGAIRVDALSFDVPSVVVENARLTLSLTNSSVEPVISCNHALIGESAASRVDVSGSAEWTCAGSLRVGGSGEGILTVQEAGAITSGEGRIGGSGGGHVNVGEDGSWTTGNLAIGMDGGSGDLTIQDGGSVQSDLAVIGQDAGTINNVIVQGNSAGGSPSTWSADILGVGSRGGGRLEVRDGASVTANILKIGNESLIFGTVIVNGTGANSTPSKIATELLFVGSRAVSESCGLKEAGWLKQAASKSISDCSEEERP
jgi:T5SS/PEP-CTERM-associated repeat protein